MALFSRSKSMTMKSGNGVLSVDGIPLTRVGDESQTPVSEISVSRTMTIVTHDGRVIDIAVEKDHVVVSIRQDKKAKPVRVYV